VPAAPERDELGPLSALNLSHSYRKGANDIAREFYLPCHARATTYDRAVGFFSTSIYAIAWPSLTKFVARGGTMRLICSPMLSAQDQAAIAHGYEALEDAAGEARLAEELRDEVRRLLSHPHLQKPTRVLAALIALRVVEVRIAVLSSTADVRSRAIFHDKVGIFRDGSGNSVAFKGSMNETWSGLSGDGNLESVDVFVSWGGDREHGRVEDERQYFDALWANDYPSVTVKPFPEVAQSELLDSADPDNWVALADEIAREIELAQEMSPEKRPGARIPRRHQIEALRQWRSQGRRGILEHATGSGKTFTALCAIDDALRQGEIPLVLAPSSLLVDHWVAEVRRTFADEVAVLVCDGRNQGWRTWLGPYSRQTGNGEPRVLIASMATAARRDFLDRVRQGTHLFLVADEVHALGSSQRRQVFTLDTGPRLGLSATPERAGDAEGTNAIFDYFEGLVPPPFTLQDAIGAGALCRYFYYVHTVQLKSDEQTEWDTITNEIRRAYAQGRNDSQGDGRFADRVKHLLLQRARIVKRAAGKVPLALRVVQDQYKEGDRWLVYCDSRQQLDHVIAAFHEAGLPATAYHSAMEASRDATLIHFEKVGGIVVAIKCLDEGVDIPATSHALILASSKNPREFIQRRGRVLRVHSGKQFAFIHDAIVVPNLQSGDHVGNRMLAGELARALEFSRGSANPGAATDIELIAAEYELDLSGTAREGVEDEEESDE
jgi:superfamily II DNA or RNA helicase